MVLRRSRFSPFSRKRRIALTEEKKRLFLDPETPCFLTPLSLEDTLMRARSVHSWVGGDQRIPGVVCF
jgi:hypothetical protein